MDKQFEDILENMELARNGVEPKIRLKHVADLANKLFVVNNDLNVSAILEFEKATSIGLTWAVRDNQRRVGLTYKDIAIEFFTIPESKIAIV